MNPLTDAIQYANSKQHGGAGYTLRVYTNDRGMVEVDVYSRTYMRGHHQVSGFLFRKRTADGDQGPEQFFNPVNVTKVEVIW